MRHLGFIVAAYALGVAVPAGYAIAAFVRAGAAKRRLAAVETARQ